MPASAILVLRCFFFWAWPVRSGAGGAKATPRNPFEDSAGHDAFSSSLSEVSGSSPLNETRLATNAASQLYFSCYIFGLGCKTIFLEWILLP
jgi:hypothetical protein